MRAAQHLPSLGASCSPDQWTPSCLRHEQGQEVMRHSRAGIWGGGPGLGRAASRQPAVHTALSVTGLSGLHLCPGPLPERGLSLNGLPKAPTPSNSLVRGEPPSLLGGHGPELSGPWATSVES